MTADSHNLEESYEDAMAGAAPMRYGGGMRGVVKDPKGRGGIASKMMVSAEEEKKMVIPLGRRWSILGGDEYSEKPREAISREILQLLHADTVAELRSARLPRTDSEERLARLRRPIRRSDALLREGTPMKGVAAQAALHCLERWVRTLRSQKSESLHSAPMFIDSDLPRLISELVHVKPEWEGRPLGLFEAPPPPSPVPGEAEPMGAALRRIVPKPVEVSDGKPWVFLLELLAALDLEENFILSSPIHAPCLSKAERHAALQKGGAYERRRAAVSPDAGLRLQSDKPWATFNISRQTSPEGYRETSSACPGPRWSPRFVLSSQPIPERPLLGPGCYSLTPSAERRLAPRGEFPTAGRLRSVCSVSSLSHAGRWTLSRADPWGANKMPDC